MTVCCSGSPRVGATCRHPHFFELKPMIAGLAMFMGATVIAGHKGKDAILLKADRADIMYGITIRSVCLELINDIAACRLNKAILRFLFLKPVLTINLIRQFLQPIAQIDVHHVHGSQLAGKTVQKLLGFGWVALAIAAKQLLDGFNRGGRLPSKRNGASGQTKNRLKLSEKFHRIDPESFVDCSHSISFPEPHKTGGYQPTFPQSLGTGAGRRETDLQSKIVMEG